MCMVPISAITWNSSFGNFTLKFLNVGERHLPGCGLGRLRTDSLHTVGFCAFMEPDHIVPNSRDSKQLLCLEIEVFSEDSDCTTLCWA